MRESIIMSRREYDNFRNKVYEEVKEELDEEYKKFPFTGFVVILLIYGWLFPKVLEGYTTFPKITILSIICGSIMLMMSLYFLYLSIRAHYNKIYN